jgi:hypothetical protein
LAHRDSVAQTAAGTLEQRMAASPRRSRATSKTCKKCSKLRLWRNIKFIYQRHGIFLARLRNLLRPWRKFYTWGRDGGGGADNTSEVVTSYFHTDSLQCQQKKNRSGGKTSNIIKIV